MPTLLTPSPSFNPPQSPGQGVQGGITTPIKEMKRLRLGVVSAGLRSHSWLEKADDPSVSKPHTPSAPSQLCHLQSSFPTVAAASPVCGHAHPPSRPCALCIAPNVLLFKLYGTFFFFCKSNGTTWNKSKKIKVHQEKCNHLSCPSSQTPPGHTQNQH